MTPRHNPFSLMHPPEPRRRSQRANALQFLAFVFTSAKISMFIHSRQVPVAPVLSLNGKTYAACKHLILRQISSASAGYTNQGCKTIQLSLASGPVGVAAGLTSTEGRETGKGGKVECAPQFDPINNSTHSDSSRTHCKHAGDASVCIACVV